LTAFIFFKENCKLWAARQRGPLTASSYFSKKNEKMAEPTKSDQMSKLDSPSSDGRIRSFHVLLVYIERLVGSIQTQADQLKKWAE
jgi:hypothetical protein